MTLPNFLFIGTGKAGSTSLYYYLKQHPEVYMSPIKETNFFSYEGGRPDFCGPGDRKSDAHHNTIISIEDYIKNFQGANGEKAIGEVSPSYLYIPQAPSRIKKYIPEAKLIVILRNPIDRAYSNFSGLTKVGREPNADFLQAVKEEDLRIAENWAPTWHYINNGFYYVQLKRYFDLFDRERFKIYLFEDWISNTIEVLQDIFTFIGVDNSFVPDISKKHNVSGKPKNKLLHKYLTQPNPLKTSFKKVIPDALSQKLGGGLRSYNLQEIPKLNSDVRYQLIQIYREDILKLQNLIDRNLLNWLEI